MYGPFIDGTYKTGNDGSNNNVNCFSISVFNTIEIDVASLILGATINTGICNETVFG